MSEHLVLFVIIRIYICVGYMHVRAVSRETRVLSLELELQWVVLPNMATGN